MSSKFTLKSRLKSFGNALNGIFSVAKSEVNFRIHLVATLAAISLGLYFKIDRNEWIWIIFSIGLVLTSEAFNTAIEKLVDLAEPHRNKKAGLIKDISAGAVLLAAITAAITGAVIFIPKIF